MVDIWPGPEQSYTSHRFPCPWNVTLPAVPTAGALFKDTDFTVCSQNTRTVCSCDYLHSIWNWSQLRPLHKLKILPRGCGDLLILQESKTSLTCKFPSLLNVSPTELSSILCPPCTGPVSDSTQKIHKVAIQQCVFSCISFVTESQTNRKASLFELKLYGH